MHVSVLSNHNKSYWEEFIHIMILRIRRLFKISKKFKCISNYYILYGNNIIIFCIRNVSTKILCYKHSARDIMKTKLLLKF